MSEQVSDGQFVTEDGDVWCCEQCYNLASQSSEPECWCSDSAQEYGLTDAGCPRHHPSDPSPGVSDSA